MTQPSGMGPLGIGNRFPSLPSMRAAHTSLLRQRNDTGIQPEIIDFVERCKATGSLLDSLAEREQAQSLIDYWTARLYSLPVDASPASLHSSPVDVSPASESAVPDDTALNAFDPSLAPELEDHLCPYRGLDAFAEKDRDHFFGREAIVQAILKRLTRERLVVVAGPSGSGKSSVVLAGLVPALKQGLGDLTSAQWHYYSPVVPGAEPLMNLALMVQPASSETQEWIQRQPPRMLKDPLHLTHLIEQQHKGAVCIFIDQFEELFTLCRHPDRRRAFVDNIFSLLSARANHRVIITVRSDYVEQLIQLPQFKKTVGDQDVLITPQLMTAGELREAIEKPADTVGLKFEDGIVDDLVQEVLGEPAALPLLQFTLLKLWENRTRNRITWDAYRQVGSPHEALGRTANQLFQSMLPEDQDAARAIFLELVQPSSGMEFTRRRLRRESLKMLAAQDRIDRVLQRLVEAGLLRKTRGMTTDEDRFDVVHEALIRNWPKLSEWLEKKRDEMGDRLRLRAAAELWNNSGRDRGALLSGKLLEQAKSYRGLDSLESDYIKASETRQTAQLRNVVGLLTFALLVMALLFGVAFWGWVSANRQATAAREALDRAEQAEGEAEQAQTEVKQQTQLANESKKSLENRETELEHIKQQIKDKDRILQETENQFEKIAGLDGVQRAVSDNHQAQQSFYRLNSLFGGKHNVIQRSGVAVPTFATPTTSSGFRVFYSFALNAFHSPQAVDPLADMIRNMEADLIALQEVRSPKLLRLLMRRLPEFGLVTTDNPSRGASPTLAILYRKEYISPNGKPDTVSGGFARKPLVQRFRIGGQLEFTLINVHLTKPMRGAAAARRQRAAEIESLATWVRSQEPQTSIVLEGVLYASGDDAELEPLKSLRGRVVTHQLPRGAQRPLAPNADSQQLSEFLLFGPIAQRYVPESCHVFDLLKQQPDWGRNKVVKEIADHNPIGLLFQAN